MLAVSNKLMAATVNATSCEISDHEFIKFRFVSELKLVTDIKTRTNVGAKNQHSESHKKICKVTIELRNIEHKKCVWNKANDVIFHFFPSLAF